MITDLKTVLWKERKVLLRPGGSRARTVLTLLTPVVLLGIVLPLQMGEEWLQMGWSLAASFFVPVILIATTIPESFAGERERRTLETLLATRLPDRAILFGKLTVSFTYGWLMTLLLLLVSLVVVNLVNWNGKVQFYAQDILVANLVMSILVSGVMATLGVLISLRAATVQSAQQTLMMAIMVPLILLQAIAFLLPTFLPKETIRDVLAKLDFNQILLIFFGVLLLANMGLFLATVKRFQRERLAMEL